MQGHVRKKGARWYYSFEASTVEGKRKRIERSGGRTKKEAEQALRKAISEYENAGLLFEPTEVSVSDYMDYWFKEYVVLNCKYNTQLSYTNIIEKHIKPALGKYKLKSLSPTILQQLINEKHIHGFSRNYLKSMHGVLSGSLKLAVYPYNFIKDNPMQYVKLPKVEQSKSVINHKVISQENYSEMITRFPPGSSYFIPLTIAYHTGMRASEVCGLTWDHVDFENKRIRIDRITIKKEREWYLNTPKTNSSNRIIPIGESLISILKQHKKNQAENKLSYGSFYVRYFLDRDDRIYTLDHSVKLLPDPLLHFICTTESGSLVTTDTLKYCSRIINYELGIPFNFHSLRHTHATMLIENGAVMKDVQTRLGHSKITTTMDTYIHATEKMSTNTVDIFEEKIIKKAKLPTR